MSAQRRYAKAARHPDSRSAGQDAGMGTKPSEASVEQIQYLIKAPCPTGGKRIDLVHVYANSEIGQRNRSPNCAIVACTIPGRIRGVV